DQQDTVRRMLDAIEHADALFVVGIDRLVTDSLGRTRTTSAIANLNQRRDELPQLIDARVIFWASNVAYPSLNEVAHDLCEVMMTTAEFTATRPLIAEPLRIEALPEWLDVAGASDVPGLEQQLETLKRVHETATDPRSAADAAASLAEVSIKLGRLTDSATWLEDAANRHAESEQWLDAARQRRRLAEVSLFLGKLDDAFAQAERAVALAKQGGDEQQVALARALVADIVRRRGEVERALEVLQTEVLPTFERLGDIRSQAVALGYIADILDERGELTEALRIRRQEQLPLYQQLGDFRGLATTLGKIADILVRHGEVDEALQIYRDEALSASERIGDARTRALLLGKIADIQAARGEAEEALRIRRDEELPIYEGLDDVRAQAIVWGKIAEHEDARGELESSLQIRKDKELPIY